MVKKGISVQRNLKGNFEFISKEKKDKNLSVTVSKEPDKIKSLSINFFYYSYIRLCNCTYLLIR